MADDVVALLQLYQFGSLRHTSLGHLHRVGVQAYCGAALVDDHQVVIVGNHLGGNHVARLVRYGHGLHSLAVAACLAVLIHSGALAVSVLAEHHDALLLHVVDHAHAHHTVSGVVIEDDALHARAHSSHVAYQVLGESHHSSACVGHDDFVLSVGQLHAYHLVVLAYIDGVHAVGTHAAVFCEECLLDDAVLGAEHHMM